MLETYNNCVLLRNRDKMNCIRNELGRTIHYSGEMNVEENNSSILSIGGWLPLHSCTLMGIVKKPD